MRRVPALVGEPGPARPIGGTTHDACPGIPHAIEDGGPFRGHRPAPEVHRAERPAPLAEGIAAGEPWAPDALFIVWSLLRQVELGMPRPPIEGPLVLVAEAPALTKIAMAISAPGSHEAAARELGTPDVYRPSPRERATPALFPLRSRGGRAWRWSPEKDGPWQEIVDPIVESRDYESLADPRRIAPGSGRACQRGRFPTFGLDRTPRGAIQEQPERPPAHATAESSGPIPDGYIRCSGPQLAAAFLIGNDDRMTMAERAKAEGDLKDFLVHGGSLYVLPSNEMARRQTRACQGKVAGEPEEWSDEEEISGSPRLA